MVSMITSLDIPPDTKALVESAHADLMGLARMLETWIDLATKLVNVAKEFHDSTSNVVTHVLEADLSSMFPHNEPDEPHGQSIQAMDFVTSMTTLKTDFHSVTSDIKHNIIQPMQKFKSLVDLLPGLRAVYENAEKDFITAAEKHCAALSPSVNPQIHRESSQRLFDCKQDYFYASFHYHKFLDRLQKDGNLFALSIVEKWTEAFRSWCFTDHKLLLDCVNHVARGTPTKVVTIQKLEKLKTVSEEPLDSDYQEELSDYYVDLGLTADDQGAEPLTEAQQSFAGYLFYYKPGSTASWQRVYCRIDHKKTMTLATLKDGKETQLFSYLTADITARPTVFQNRTHVVEVYQHSQLLCYLQTTTEREQIVLLSVLGVPHATLRQSLTALGANGTILDQYSSTDIHHSLGGAGHESALHDTHPKGPDHSGHVTGERGERQLDVEMENLNLKEIKGDAIKVGKLLVRSQRTKGSKQWEILRDSGSAGEWRATAATIVAEYNGYTFGLYDNTNGNIVETVTLAGTYRTSVQIDDESLFDKKYCFHLNTGHQGTLYFTVDSADDRNAWLSALKTVTQPEIFGPVALGTPLYFRAVRMFWIRVTEAKDLAPASYYCSVLLDDMVRAKTPIRLGTNGNNCPFWKEEFLFTDLATFYSGVAIGLYTTSKGRKDVLAGQAIVPIPTLRRGEAYEGWYPVLGTLGGSQFQPEASASGILRAQTPINHQGPADSGHQPTLVPVGSLRLKLRYDEIVVLPSAKYQPLLALLVDYRNNLIFDLATVTKNVEWLSETLLKIFLSKNLAAPWFDYLAVHEVSHTDDHNILFRGNSVLTKSLDAYMKIVGLSYVEETIGTLIRNICHYRVMCEVDPAKLPAGDDVAAQWKILLLYVRILWSSIEQSKPRCPSELRLIFSRLRKVIEDRFGHHADPNAVSTARYTCVSGFFFLRLICPAILSPKQYGLVKDNPEPKVHRTLTLLAKSVQCLANLSEFGAKEPHMFPMNEFVMENSAALMEFIDFIATESDDNGLHRPHMDSPPGSPRIQLLAERQNFQPPTAPYLVDLDKELAALAFFVTRHRAELQKLEPHAHHPPQVMTRLINECDQLNRITRACWASGLLESTQHPTIGPHMD